MGELQEEMVRSFSFLPLPQIQSLILRTTFGVVLTLKADQPPCRIICGGVVFTTGAAQLMPNGQQSVREVLDQRQSDQAQPPSAAG